MKFPKYMGTNTDLIYSSDNTAHKRKLWQLLNVFTFIRWTAH